MEVCIARGFSTRSKIYSLRRLPFVLSRSKSTSKSTKATLDAYTRPANETTLTWPEYFTIRRSKRRWQMFVTAPCAMLGFAGGVLYFGTQETDPLKPIFGIDPFFFYGFCTVGCVGIGALLGPTIGSALWRYSHRNVASLIDAKDVQFFQRVAKNRVDATLQSPTHPVPDYYGEKIGSLHQYRQWLRDQAKYKRKALLPEEL